MSKLLLLATRNIFSYPVSYKLKKVRISKGRLVWVVVALILLVQVPMLGLEEAVMARSSSRGPISTLGSKMNHRLLNCIKEEWAVLSRKEMVLK